MTTPEFSNAFDTLLNSYANQIPSGSEASKQDIVLDEYEKSFFLTNAQEELIRGLYSGRNFIGESFEQTEELRRYLSDLVMEDTPKPVLTSNGYPLGIESSSRFFTLKDDVWFITYECVKLDSPKCEQMGILDVYPVTQDEYHKIKRNPFRGANNRRALRLDLSEGVVEIVCKYPITEYYIRYLKKPEPIRLGSMDDVTVGGESSDNPCKLNSSLHQKILELAVVAALRSKGINVSRNNNENK